MTEIQLLHLILSDLHIERRRLEAVLATMPNASAQADHDDLLRAIAKYDKQLAAEKFKRGLRK